MTSSGSGLPAVEVRPEVLFLSEVLEELTRGRLRIPRFQRPFVWRRDQMTDLLDSVRMQYPIGSILVWETDLPVATLAKLGPFRFPDDLPSASVGYVLDGHQRLSTLAGALVPRAEHYTNPEDDDPGRWDLVWNIASGRFEHGVWQQAPGDLFPLTSLLDTLQFFQAIDRVRSTLVDAEKVAEVRIADVSQLAKAFQYYRIPVVRIRQTGLTEAVEIFARLNSKGQVMSADQMVSALVYRLPGSTEEFDLAVGIDELAASLGERGFGGVERTAILRAILANMDEDIYKTDWTRMAVGRRSELLPRLRDGVSSAAKSLDLAVDFLQDIGVKIGRLLPYAMQLVVLSAFFDRQPHPSESQLSMLRRWFWVSSFSGWFGGANPSRVNGLVAEFRQIASHGEGAPKRLENLDLEAKSLPYPSSFDMRSARTRTLLLVMLSLRPRGSDGSVIEGPWHGIAERGPEAVGYIVSTSTQALTRDPANRMIRPPGAERGLLRSWVENWLVEADSEVLRSHGMDKAAVGHLRNGDIVGFLAKRQQILIAAEGSFRQAVGVSPSDTAIGKAPIDTD